MRNLLILLLIVPMIGSAQLLNLPVKEVVILEKFNQKYIVPDGHVLQLVSSFQTSGSLLYVDDDFWNIDFKNNHTVDNFRQMGNPVFPSGTEIYWKTNFAFATFVLFDLNAQNLAYNLPQQSTPTLFPNPTSSLLALNSDKEYDIEVYDMLGNKLMALTGNSINMEHLSTATYIVKATDKSNNEELTYKVVKN